MTMSDERRINPLAQYRETGKAGGLRKAMQLEPMNEYEQVRDVSQPTAVFNHLMQGIHVPCTEVGPHVRSPWFSVSHTASANPLGPFDPQA